MWTNMMRSTLFKPIPQILVLNRQKCELNHAVREGEKVVGYSTSFLNLRWILTDEIANVALHIRKLIGTDHPLLHTARKLFMENTATWGLIVLLMSKAAGLNNLQNNMDKDHIAGILNAQRVIAEVTEMIRISSAIHKSIINVRDVDHVVDLNFGNKIALLCGDYLLGNSYEALANIHNQNVAEIMSSTLRDLVEAEFIDRKPYKPTITVGNISIKHNFSCDLYDYNIALGNPRAEWIYRNILGGASLLAKSCKSVLMLANHSEHIQQMGYIFGKNIALARQIQLEREQFVSNSHNSFSLISAPVMLHLEQDASFFDLITSEEVDYNELRTHINRGNALTETKLLQNEFCTNALNVLKELPESTAQNALKNIVKTIA